MLEVLEIMEEANPLPPRTSNREPPMPIVLEIPDDSPTVGGGGAAPLAGARAAAPRGILHNSGGRNTENSERSSDRRPQIHLSRNTSAHSTPPSSRATDVSMASKEGTRERTKKRGIWSRHLRDKGESSPLGAPSLVPRTGTKTRKRHGVPQNRRSSFLKWTGMSDKGEDRRDTDPSILEDDEFERCTIEMIGMRRLWRHPRVQGPGADFSEIAQTFGELSVKHRLDAFGLQRLLYSPCNELFDKPREGKVKDDGEYMNYPLTDYFIATSHNSYLVGDQFASNSDTRMYEVQLQMGCRCLEIDCWDGTDGEPDVKHGRTMTSAIKFKDVMVSIEKYAFTASPYPVILSLEMHCSLPQQEKIATYLKDILKEKLHVKPFGYNPASPTAHLPSPNDLKYKVLVKGRQLPSSGGLDADDDSDDDDEDMDKAMKKTAKAEGRCHSIETNVTVAHGPGFEDSMNTVSSISGQTSSSTAGRGTSQSSDSPPGRGGRDTDSPDPETSLRSAGGLAHLQERDNKMSISEQLSAGRASDEVSISSKGGRGSLPLSVGGLAEGSAVTAGGRRMRGSCEDSARQATRMPGAGGADAKKPDSHGKKPTARSLSDITACFAKKFDGFWAPNDPRKPPLDAWAMSSYKEAVSTKYINDGKAAEWATHNTAHFSRVYPAGSRLNSSNYEPHKFWDAGVQMAALNYQTFDLGYMLNLAMFEANGGCGYVLKPQYLRAGGTESSDGADRGSIAARPRDRRSDRRSAARERTGVKGEFLVEPLPPLLLPKMLFRLKIQLIAATHVPTPNDPFLDSHCVDAKAVDFLWWKEAPSKGVLKSGGATKIAEAKLCDPIVTCEVYRGLFSGVGNAEIVDTPAPAESSCTSTVPGTPAGAPEGSWGRSVDGVGVVVGNRVKKDSVTGAVAQKQPLTHGSIWESSPVKNNGLNPYWEEGTAEFDIVASHPEITQAVFAVCYRPRPNDKPRQLALGMVNLACARPGLRCLSLREPKHGLPLRFTKLLLRVSKEAIPLESFPAATTKSKRSVKQSMWGGDEESHHCRGSEVEGASAFGDPSAKQGRGRATRGSVFFGGVFSDRKSAHPTKDSGRKTRGWRGSLFPAAMMRKSRSPSPGNKGSVAAVAAAVTKVKVFKEVDLEEGSLPLDRAVSSVRTMRSEFGGFQAPLS